MTHRLLVLCGPIAVVAQLDCSETWTGTAHAYVYRVAVIQ